MTESCCPLCSHPETVRFAARTVRNREWHVARCRACKLVFTDPQPTEADIQGFYLGAFHTQLRRSGGSEAAFGAKFDAYCEWLKRHVPPGRSLDIGCATGLLVKKLRDAGFQAEGCEVNPDSAEWGRKHYGVTIHAGHFDPRTPQSSRYDLVTLCDVLDQTGNPAEYLTGIHNLLRPGAYVMVTFPDIWSLESLYYRALSKLMRRDWLWRTCHVPGHTWEFTPRTARRVFEQSGFRVVAFRRRQDSAEPVVWQGPTSLIHYPPRMLSLGLLGNRFGTQMHFLLRARHS